MGGGGKSDITMERRGCHAGRSTVAVNPASPKDWASHPAPSLPQLQPSGAAATEGGLGKWTTQMAAGPRWARGGALLSHHSIGCRQVTRLLMETLSATTCTKLGFFGGAFGDP